MENEQKHIIPLDSPLDTNSNDMLVPIATPKFAFNRQRYLGSVLPTSVRYEDEGWFAGWHGHNFDHVQRTDSYIEPALGLADQLTVVPKQFSNGTRYYHVEQKDKVISFDIMPDWYINWISGSGSFNRINDQIVQVQGQTNKGDTFTAEVNVYTGALSSFTSPNIELGATSSIDNQVTELDVFRKPGPLGDYVQIRKGQNASLYNGTIQLLYSRDAAISHWGGVFQYTDAGILTSLNDVVALQSFNAQNPNQLGEVINATIINRSPILRTFNLEKKLLPSKIQYSNLSSGQSWYSVNKEDLMNERDTGAKTNVNKIETVIVTRKSSGLEYDNWVLLTTSASIWLRHRLHNITAVVQNVDTCTAFIDPSVWKPLPLRDDDGDLIEYTPAQELANRGYVYTIRFGSADSNIAGVITDPTIINATHQIRINEGVWHNVNVTDNEVQLFVMMKQDTSEEETVDLMPDAINKIEYRVVNNNPSYPIPVGEAYFTAAIDNTTVGYTIIRNLESIVDSLQEDIDALDDQTAAQNVWNKYFGTTTDVVSAIEALNEESQVDTVKITYTFLADLVSKVMSELGPLVDIDYSTIINNLSQTLTVQVTSHSYTPLANRPYWNVLNTISGDDNTLFAVNGRYINIVIPQCVYAYAFTKIVTVNILNDEHSSNVMTNSELNIACFRFDSEGLNIATISATFPYVVDSERSANPENNGDAAVEFVTIAVTGTETQYLYQARTVSLPTSYPWWILTDDYGADNGHYRPYIPGRAYFNEFNLNVLMQYFAFIDSVSSSVKVEFDNLWSNAVIRDFTTTERVDFPMVINGGNFTQNVSITPNIELLGDKTTLDYNVNTATIANIEDQYTASDTVTVSSHTKVENMRNIVVLRQISKVPINVLLYRTFIVSKTGLMQSAAIESQTANMLTLNVGVVDLANAMYTSDDTDVILSSVENNSNDIRIHVARNNVANVRYIPIGIFYSSAGIVFEQMTISDAEYSIIFNYIDSEYTLHIDRNGKFQLIYSVTDCRNGDYREVYARDTSDVMMFIKQFWSNTVLTENYWYIDKDHVLELTSHDIILHQRTIELHDWMGDRWEVVKKAPRGNFFGTADLYYNVSSALNCKPILYKLQDTETAINILYIEDIIGTDFNEPVWLQTSVPVERATFGSRLRPKAISSYASLIPASIISTGKISSTHLPNKFLIGIACGKSLKQWTIDVYTGNIITGYGHVGLDGSLTGGQFPAVACDNSSGFNGVVYSLDKLKDYENNSEIPNIYVGTESTVWFLQRDIVDIVSHYKYVDGVHVAQTMRLTNHVETRYESMSFSKAKVFDMMMRTLGISDLFSGANTTNPAQQAINILGPSVFCANVKYTMFSHINHSLGNYAYVYKNATQRQASITSDLDKQNVNTMTDQEIVFGKYEKNITYSDDNDNQNKIYLELILKAIQIGIDAATTAATARYFANNSQNQMASDDNSGRKWSQFFTDNVATTVSSSLQSSGFIASLKSKIQLRYSLGMFYSVSDDNQCFAGPGFVNHNFQAQCLAQSVTDNQTDGKRVGYFIVFKAISAFANDLKAYGLQSIAQALDQVTASVGSFTFGGPLLAAAALLASKLAYVAAEIYVAAGPVIKGICDAIGSEVGTGYLSGAVANKNLSIEGVHAYGNKNMSMFWPAFGITTPVKYTDESVSSGFLKESQKVNLCGSFTEIPTGYTQDFSDETQYDNQDFYGGGLQAFKGNLYSCMVSCKGVSSEATAPADMAVVEGTSTFLSASQFKNEQIGAAPPTFAPPAIHDYCINKRWNLAYTAAAGEVISVTCDDTKILDGLPSNIVVTDDFCGIASSYIAMEIKDSFDENYLRPWLITPNAIALNINRINCVHDTKAYHAFDGYSNRFVKWTGGSGMDKQMLYQQYAFQINDHFKRSNIWPPSQFFGIFNGPPELAVRTYDKMANLVTALGKQEGLDNNIPGENKSLQRFSVPVHSEPLSTLPAMLRMLQPYKLHVVEGVTSLTTDIRSTQTAYKAPSSVDFNINGIAYRATEEFINELQQKVGIVGVQDIVATAGMDFIGATTKVAFFYSAATRMYYTFSGGRDLTKQDILNRFKDVKAGRWDFVNQEVMFKCLLGNDVLVCRLDGDVLGEIYPPNETIYNQRSDFLLYSVAGGTVYQGPRRFAVNRFITLEYMYKDIIRNKRLWDKLDRELYEPERNYRWKYADVTTRAPITAVKGWTHNPTRLVTSMLGIDEETDCKFEWEITFAWTEVMEALYDHNKEYVTVNVKAETVTQGGVVTSRPTHIFLSKECFTRSGNAGYYMFKYQSNNGIGNRERLYLWSDGIIAIEDVSGYVKNITQHRTQPLHTQVDVMDLVEL